MSGRTITQQQFEQLEAYILHRMEAAEKARFETMLEQDPVLRAAYEMQREHMLALELAGMEALLREMAAEPEAKRSGGPGPGRWLKYAAAVVLLLAGGVWWATRPSATERAFAEHHWPDPGLPVPMHITKDPLFQDAMVAYKLGEAKEAADKWRSILALGPANDTLIYFIAQAELQLGDAAAAGQGFAVVAADSSSVFRAKARWYLYLALLRQGDFAGMDSLQMEQDPLYGERARDIRGQLGR